MSLQAVLLLIYKESDSRVYIFLSERQERMDRKVFSTWDWRKKKKTCNIPIVYGLIGLGMLGIIVIEAAAGQK